MPLEVFCIIKLLLFLKRVAAVFITCVPLATFPSIFLFLSPRLLPLLWLAVNLTIAILFFHSDALEDFAKLQRVHNCLAIVNAVLLVLSLTTLIIYSHYYVILSRFVLLPTEHFHRHNRHINIRCSLLQPKPLYEPAGQLPTINMGQPFYRVKPFI